MPAKKKTAPRGATKKTTAKKTAPKPPKNLPQINLQQFLEEVKKRAYEIFLERGAGHGNDLGDWIKAEAEIKQRYGIK
jgi:hypothetical protein